ncbi:MAG: molybdenum cofactor guanylyltransferase [Halioglobus sp.]|nr:molybdenum cofactor guanylyltransferase [Halioglobus sp.]
MTQASVSRGEITGLILAGGAGRRVGGRDKGLLLWHGKPLVEHVRARLAPQVDKVLLSCNRNEDTYREFAADIVTDTRRDFQGPMAGLEAAIPCIDTQFIVLTACDTPQLPLDLVARLLQPLSAVSAPARISYAHDGEREQYLCAALHRSCLADLSVYLDEGHRTVRHWYRRHRCCVVDFSDQPESFQNFNRLNAQSARTS